MPSREIPFGRPMIDSAEADAVVKVLASPQLVHGPVTHAFEHAFAERAGAKHAISVGSCTAGLHLSLLVKDVGPGDEVIVPAMTHVATAHAVEFCGAKPVFVDVEADTGNIDPAAVERAITKRTRAIMVVHYLGLPCDMDRINAAAAKAGAFVVEDCALAIDATYGDRKAGTLGLTGCFSFYPVKHMTTIEGGMVTTNDDRVAHLLTERRAFGYDRALDKRPKPGIYDVISLGYNYRMNEVEAAVGLVQLGKLDAAQKARARNFKILREGLSKVSGLTVFAPTKGRAVSSHYCLNVLLPKDGSIDRDAVSATIRAAGVGTSVHYPQPVPRMSYYRSKYGWTDGSFPVATWLADQTISLPVGPHLADDDAAHIATVVAKAVQEHRGRTK